MRAELHKVERGAHPSDFRRVAVVHLRADGGCTHRPAKLHGTLDGMALTMLAGFLMANRVRYGSSDDVQRVSPCAADTMIAGTRYRLIGSAPTDREARKAERKAGA